MSKMTKGERDELKSLINARAKREKAKAQAHGQAVLADCEKQLAARFSQHHAAFKDLTVAAEAFVRKTDAEIAKKCRELGIPDEFRPGLGLQWYDRGENAMIARRAELRRVAESHVAALVANATGDIEDRRVDALTAIATASLDSDAAKQILASLPDVETLIPKVDVANLPTDGMSKSAQSIYRLISADG